MTRKNDVDKPVENTTDSKPDEVQGEGNYDAARDCLEHARDAYGAYGRQTSQWYDWSVRVLLTRLALRRLGFTF